MKSKRAEDLLGRSYDGGHVLMENAERAVEIAEQEAEERVRAELTRWHDPKEELPDSQKTVLLKIQDEDGTEYRTGWLCNDRTFMASPVLYDEEVVGWREIHE